MVEKNKKEKVLDKGHVELVSYMGSDLTVVNAARVSFASESHFDIDHGGRPCLYTKDEKLIEYLAKHNHWTPFAHPQITLRIKAPISIRTQFFKHKQGFVENEISRRYVDTPPEFYHPKWRHRPTGNAKQGSDGWLECVDGGGETSGGFATHPLYESYKHLMNNAIRTYEELISSNVAPEQARFVLPQGMYTEWYWTGSLAAYARFYKQRIEEHAQWEIQQYAEAVGKIINPLFKKSWSVLTKQPT
jgi:thymidylate synthase (FAD)